MTSYAVRRSMGKTLLALFLFAFVLAQVFPLLWVASYSLQKSGGSLALNCQASRSMPVLEQLCPCMD